MYIIQNQSGLYFIGTNKGAAVWSKSRLAIVKFSTYAEVFDYAARYRAEGARVIECTK